MDISQLTLEQMTRAFLRLLQEDNGCNKRVDGHGQPCHEHCACWLELMEYYKEAE